MQAVHIKSAEGPHTSKAVESDLEIASRIDIKPGRR